MTTTNIILIDKNHHYKTMLEAIRVRVDRKEQGVE